MTRVEWGKYQNFWHTGYSHHRGKSEFLYDSACLIIVNFACLIIVNFLVVPFFKYSVLVSFSNIDLVYSWKEVYLLVNTPFQYGYFLCAFMSSFQENKQRCFATPCLSLGPPLCLQCTLHIPTVPLPGTHHMAPHACLHHWYLEVVIHSFLSCQLITVTVITF